MKMHYWQGSNFGDELNPWMWKQLLPKPLEDCFSPETLFCGIGTILNDKLPSTSGKVKVFGSGYGYGRPPEITACWHVYCVRGPLTAAALDLPDWLAITDSAMLVRELVAPADTQDQISFMPHHTTARSTAWKDICDAESICYLDPAAAVPETIDSIRRSSLVIAEAMHGAILADTFRIPWIPVRTSAKIFDFKWQDWGQSLGLEQGFELLPTVHSTGRRRIVNARLAAHKLKSLKRKGKRCLSDERVADEVYKRLLGRFEDLKTDVATAS